MEIGRRIRLAREHKGLDLRAFSRAMKLTYETVRSWEAPGGTQPRPNRYKRIAEVTGVRLAWLASGEEPMLDDGRTSQEARADAFTAEADALSPALQRILSELIAEVARISRRK